ncbi:unnamed protein product [Parajaminaea phylloscopi]
MDRLKSVNEALSGAKPFSSISVWFDRLTANSYKEDDYEGIPELVESINLQASGPAEASRCARKKLKYGSVHGQKRAITILGALVENCGPRFQSTFADERLVNQIKLTSADPLVDASVRRKLMRLLLSWQISFSKEPTMRTVAGLYAACGGGRERQEREAQRKRSEAEELVRKQEEERKRDMQIRMDRKTAERLQKEEDKKNKGRNKNVRGQPRRFNYEQEKPNILNHLAVSSRSATNLVNALQHVNRERESVGTNTRVQQCLNLVKNERKQLVRYIQLVQDEEMVGALIEANERIVVALQLYDKLSKPSTSDSEDEGSGAGGAKLIDAGTSTRVTAEQRAAAEEAEIEAVRKRLEGQDFDGEDWEGEIEKLQFKQRRGIDRHNSRRADGGHQEPGAAMKDLLDLDFDDTHSSISAGPSLRPNRQTSMSSQSASGGAPSMAAAATSNRGGGQSSQQHGTLSDYSDYDSSEDEDAAAAAAASASSSSAAAVPGGPSNRSAVQLDHGAELESWRNSRRHRPRIGEETSSLWSKEDEERWIRGDEGEDDDGDADPFGDEWEEVAGKLRASGAETGRREWTAV